MAKKLQDYQAKRDFQRTTEPQGEENGRHEHRIFVVQKHAATRLHYDFRLEMDGVLLSWAVPKGPSLDPDVRRLAVHVEDHPIDYADFEGRIPEGEYGGGTVMVWDRGIWTARGDARQAYRKGRLSFQLYGQRLRGKWSLVRSSSSDEQDHWLMIKKKDDEAAQESIVDRYDRSVLTNRTMQEISEGKESSAADAPGSMAHAAPSPADIPGATQADLPKNLKAELATSSDTVPEGVDWLYEIKYDGYRMLAFLDSSEARLISRRGHDWSDKFPAVRDALADLHLQNAVLDGEVVAITPRGTTSFQKLQNSIQGEQDHSALVYFLFDVPYLNGYDLTQTPLVRRKELLKECLQRENTSSILQYSDHVRGNGREFFDFACRSALEGIICKKAGSLYRSKRTDDWRKVKCMHRQEFVVAGYTKPQGSRTAFGALLLGVYDENGALEYCGKVGTGFSQQTLTKLKSLLDKHKRSQPPFAKSPTEDGVQWVEPVLVAEVEFREWTDSGNLRQPSFKGLREDKAPEEVRREKPHAALPNQQKQKKTTGRRRNARSPEIAGITLSNPNKILFPEMGLTKVALAEYYEYVADWMLPHIVNRPLMILRCPEGRDSECFHQKHVTQSLHEAIRGVPVPEKGKTVDMICIDDTRGLIALTQLGTLEIHPWGSPASDPDSPDRLIFDLDPDDEVAWADVVEAAQQLQSLLQTLKLVPFVRTTGGKGLHVVCPLSGRNDWTIAKEFTGAVARELVRAYPDRYVATVSKKARRGKIFVDYLRNARGATAIASYSTRAREGAPVATPIDWAELRPSMPRDHFTAERLPKRLSALKSDPWEAFSDSARPLSRAALRAVGIE